MIYQSKCLTILPAALGLIKSSILSTYNTHHVLSLQRIILSIEAQISWVEIMRLFLVLLMPKTKIIAYAPQINFKIDNFEPQTLKFFLRKS